MRIIAMKSAGVFENGITRASKTALPHLFKRLAAMNFSGVCYYSPDVSSRLTAEELNKALGINTELVAELACKNDSPERENLLREINGRISSLGIDSDLLLIISDEESLRSLCEIYHPINYKSSVFWDLSLSLLYSENGETFVNDISHISEDLRYCSESSYLELCNKLDSAISCAESFAKSFSSGILLHIGDTHTAHYAYYEKLIDAVKPDMIIHTGDFADELKAGRVDNARAAWTCETTRLFDILKSSRAKLVFVVGNNDVKNVLYECGIASVYEPNSVLEIGGVRICLTHEVWRIDPDVNADIYLYGHGPTGDDRTPIDNERGGKLYFNAFWGASIHSLSENKHLILEKFRI